jgi:uncharacterized membrane protein
MSDLQNLVNGLVVIIVALIGVVGAGGVTAFIMVMRQNKRSLEMAYNALPVEWQATIRDLVLKTGTIYDFVEDITDGDVEEGMGGAG